MHNYFPLLRGSLQISVGWIWPRIHFVVVLNTGLSALGSRAHISERKIIPHQLSSRVWVLPCPLDPDTNWLRNYISGLGGKNEQVVKVVIFLEPSDISISIFYIFFSLYILSFVFIWSFFVLVLICYSLLKQFFFMKLTVFLHFYEI